MTKLEKNSKIPKKISISGARLHNLKNISVEIPRNKLTVITGVSGSGKSTLAFDTIYAEGQRRFVESLSAYARQFLERMDKPDVDSIHGLPPAIAIEQRQLSKNPRSTVGTTTEIFDYFRLLFGRIGKTICRECGSLVRKDTPSNVVKDILACEAGDKIYILFPLSPKIKDLEFDKFRQLGFYRFVTKDTNQVYQFDQLEMLGSIDTDRILILVDRIALNTGSAQQQKEFATRLTDSVETAFLHGNGKAIVRNITKNEDRIYSSIYECARCEIVYEEPEPRLFSFNNPYGACPNCQGFGRTIGIDEELVIPDKTRSIRQGAIHPFKSLSHSQYLRDLIRIAPDYDIPLDEPTGFIGEKQMKIIWDGAGDYIGISGFFSMIEENSYKMHYRVLLSRYRGYTKCRACGGSRLRTSARQVFIGSKNIPEIITLPLTDILVYLNNLQLTDYEEKVASQVLREIKWRLGLLIDIGLGYLTLDRLTHTLSGGEAQRINLSTALGSALVGTLYVLDEPSVGMHTRDTRRLIDILYKLRNIGNTIIVVEHDPDIIEAADYIIDLGPGAGNNGGDIMFADTFENLKLDEKSLTAQYIYGKKKISLPVVRRSGSGNTIKIYNPRLHNLNIDKVEFPIGCMTVVTGVSGSGKSTLVHDILYRNLKKYKGTGEGGGGNIKKIEGVDSIEFIELVDQSPIGKSSRSTPATYTKVFDMIREFYAQTQSARQLGWKPGHFSFNVPGGRCEECEGEGYVTVEMQFLPDVHLICESCKGSRYKREVKNIQINGKSIVDVLDMTIDEAAEFFESYSRITKKLSLLRDVGLGYLKLGQPSTMLSGGESQRIKLAFHLEARSQSNTLFIFDEPTTGLHLDDISKLLACFDRLVNGGHTVIVIEHNLHVIASADWIIDLGPEAGDEGGRIVAIGTPETIAASKNSHTGKALSEFLRRYGKPLVL